MWQSLRPIKGTLIYTAIIFWASLAYFMYAYSVYPVIEEKETFMAEIGEGFGNAALVILIFIYFRTFLKLMLGEGKLAKRLLPDYLPPMNSSFLNQLLVVLNRTHVFVGITAISVILLHIALIGFSRYMHILFFPAVLILVVWQGLFGLFLTWRYSPAELKQFSYLVHAQFFTGIAIGIFALFGHILIDD